MSALPSDGSGDGRAGTGRMRRWAELAAGPPGSPARSRWAYGLYAGHLLSLGMLALSNSLLGLAALLTPWKRPARGLAAARPFLGAMAAYLLFLVASILASHQPSVSLRAASDLFNFLVPVVALALLHDRKQARWLTRALILLGSIIACHALYQYVLAVDPIGQRPSGPFSHYMTLGGFLVLIDCFLLSWMAFADGWRRIEAWVAFVLIQAALLVSYTRNAWVALAVLLALVTITRARKLLVAWAPALLVIVLLAPSPLLARFGSIFDLDDHSNYDRLCMGYAGLHMVRDRPMLGQGPRMARERYPLYRHPTTPRASVPHLHNSFLNLAAERGLTSLAALAAMLALSGRQALRCLRRRGRDPADGELPFATVLVILATLISGMFEDYWSDTEIQRLVLFALVLPWIVGPGDAESAGDAPEDGAAALSA
mgnify:CR=1 FL=1